MNRNARLRQVADQVAELTAGNVTLAYSYAPGDGWRRWVFSTPVGSRVFSTREAEAFLDGVRAGVYALAPGGAR